MVDGPTAENQRFYKAYGVSTIRPGQVSRMTGKTVTANLGTPIMGFAQFWSPLGYIVGLEQEEGSLTGIDSLFDGTSINYGQDPSWANVIALVQFSTTLPFVESKTLTALTDDPDTVESDNEIYKWGPRSMFAPVTDAGPVLTLDYGTDAFDLSNYSAWTIEFWVRFKTLPEDNDQETSFGLMSCVDYNVGTDHGWGVSVGASKLFWNNDIANVPVDKTHTMTTDRWYAICVMRSGSTIYFFQDGVRIGSNSSRLPSAITPADSLGIEFGFDALTGNTVTPDGEFNGWIDDFRLTSLARYPVTGYTVPTRGFPVG